jgi:N-acetylmuramoyl-L-alanine amidase
MPSYTIAEGDCLSSLADQYGFLPDTIWNHPQNAQLKATRQDQNVLYPGDIIFIPDLTPKQVPCAVDQTYPFVKKGVPAKLRLQLLDGDQPRANVPFQLLIDGNWITGNSDGNGFIDQPIPPSAKSGKLIVGEGTTKDIHEFQFGTVDPFDTQEGVTGRLRNLGYGTDDMAEATKAFQSKEGLTVSGEVDDATRTRLKEKFGQ